MTPSSKIPKEPFNDLGRHPSRTIDSSTGEENKTDRLSDSLK